MNGEEFHGVSAELGDAGPCPVVQYKGRAWHIGWPTQNAKGTLEGLVYQVSRQNIEDMKPFMSPAEYAEERAALRVALHAGQHKTWGELWTAVQRGPDSNTLFLLSLLREKHPDATLADARALWTGDAICDVKDAMALVIPNFYLLLVPELPVSPEQRQQIAAASAAMFHETMAAPPSTTTPPPCAPGG